MPFSLCLFLAFYLFVICENRIYLPVPSKIFAFLFCGMWNNHSNMFMWFLNHKWYTQKSNEILTLCKHVCIKIKRETENILNLQQVRVLKICRNLVTSYDDKAKPNEKQKAVCEWTIQYILYMSIFYPNWEKKN